ncbi:MAG: endonuclease [Gammaproteobacteria bacterium]|nr:MAG: endonuclease [Gammaproteobacteria bacterium]
MPEGPSLIILKELTTDFIHKKVVAAGGNSKIDKVRLVGQSIKSLRTWGKHFLIEFSGFSIKIHLLMFGTYLINDTKDATPRLSLEFSHKQSLNFYACSVKYIEGELDDAYDWSSDVMSDQWNPAAALKKIRSQPEMLLCDGLLDQEIFSGVGNIIKNEVLYRVRVHPLSTVEGLPAAKLREVVAQARRYSFEFLEWEKAFVLKQHWLAHTKSTCPRCHIPFKKAYLGKTHRRSFYCENCQKKYLK